MTIAGRWDPRISRWWTSCAKNKRRTHNTGTHILHIARNANVIGDFNRFSVFTGINDDPILYDIPATDVGWFAGGRVRPIAELPQALAKHPPYILEQARPPSWMKEPPDGYEEVFHQNTLRLFRRRAS